MLMYVIVQEVLLQEVRLTELAARIPFADRINQQANLNDFDLGLIQAFLQEIKSDLFEESKEISMADLARNMLIAKGPDENLLPVNVGLLFFNKQPEKFFARTWIELVVHNDNESNFTEHYFKGSLQTQLWDALSFLQTSIIKNYVKKIPQQAEALRFFNFPYDAVEEALSNAIYHKSYEIGKPIEVQVWQDKIEILSFPGPVPPVDAQILQSQERIVARDYRNRRIGDFLKELDLTEGRGTGLPTIYKSMERNGSPKPTFITDEQSTHFLVTLPVHPLVEIKYSVNKDLPLIATKLDYIIHLAHTIDGRVSDGAISIIKDHIHVRVIDMLHHMKNWINREELFTKIRLSNNSTNRKKYLDPLLELGLVEMQYPPPHTSWTEI